MKAPEIELSKKERRAYNLGAALLALGDSEERSGLAWEISDTLAEALTTSGGKYRGGLLVPHWLPDVQLRAGIDTKTATRGQELVFQQPGPLIEALRAKAIVLALGATELDGLVGNFKAPRLTGTATASWSIENPGGDVADSNALLDQVSLTPKELIGTTSFSRQLLIQSQVSVGADKLVRGDLALSHAVALDAAAINGTGAAGQPFGILNTAGVDKTTVAGGANGAVPSWVNICALEKLVANANADPSLETFGYATTPIMRATLRTRDRTPAATTGFYILQDGNQINGYPAVASKGVPGTLDKGTSVGVCHAILFGRWSELLIGMWGAFEVATDPYRLKKQAMIELTTYELCDITVRHTQSFVAMVDALSNGT